MFPEVPNATGEEPNTLVHNLRKNHESAPQRVMRPFSLQGLDRYRKFPLEN